MSPLSPADHQPADTPTGPQAGGRDHAAKRDQEVVGEVGDDRPPFVVVGDRPERTEQPRMVVRVLRCAGPAQDVGQRERDDRPGCDGPCAAAGDDEVRLDALIEAVGRLEQPPEGCPRRGEPERRPVARSVGPRRDPQLTEPVPEPVAVELERGPAQHMVEDRIVGLWWDEGGAHDHRRTDDRIVAPEGGIRDRPDPAVVADLDVLDAACREIGEGGQPADRRPAAVIGRERQLGHELGEGVAVRARRSGRTQEDFARDARRRPRTGPARR